MRSPEARLILGALIALAAAWSGAQPAAATLAAPAASAASAPLATLSASAVRAAVAQVQADPLLPGSEKVKTLRFKKDTERDQPKPEEAAQWWVELLANLSGGLRVAMWLVGAGLLIWVLLRLRDWLQRGQTSDKVAALPPSHVGSLDIRPQSLPADIGAAALALWQRGEARGALSLLYRGALSRLVHGHGVPIRAASTESECLALAAQRLPAAPQDFLAQLVAAWQAVAYAGRSLPDEDMARLCQAFDAQLPATATPEARP